MSYLYLLKTHAAPVRLRVYFVHLMVLAIMVHGPQRSDNDRLGPWVDSWASPASSHTSVPTSHACWNTRGGDSAPRAPPPVTYSSQFTIQLLSVQITTTVSVISLCLNRDPKDYKSEVVVLGSVIVNLLRSFPVYWAGTITNTRNLLDIMSLTARLYNPSRWYARPTTARMRLP